MTDIYAMQRANGDWFVLEDEGRLRVPVFYSSHDALMARLRTVEMLLFKPIALDARLLKEIISGRDQMDFCLVNNPFENLKRGSPVQHAQLESLISSTAPPRSWKWLSRPWS